MSWLGVAQEVLLPTAVPRTIHAPPTPPPVVSRPMPDIPSSMAPIRPRAALIRYSIGDPTGEEQLYLERINRARANPVAEAAILRGLTNEPDIFSAYQYFQVDLDLMTSQFMGIPAAPPVSLNPKLSMAARLHSGDMFTNAYQGHYGTNGSSPGDRITSQGYGWYTYGECVYSYAQGVEHGHAGFEVDWGTGPGGMQTPAGHRANIHNASFREVGIGVVNGVNGGVGPQLVTEDFSSASGSIPFVTGVVYYDLNGNNGYDVGEGIGGVRVDIAGSAYYALTAASGGYSVPVPGNGSYSVSFSGSGLSGSAMATVTSGVNVKIDFTPIYQAPVVAGAAMPIVGGLNTYSFTAVAGADAYQWRQSQLVTADISEGAESGITNVSVVSSGNYSVLANDIKASGAWSFHLCHGTPAVQRVTLNALLWPGANTELTFAARLGWATANQIARAQVSIDGGATWTNRWSLSGTGNAGQAGFTRYTNSLGDLAGRETLVRFVYDFVGGSYFNQTSSSVGLYLDDISIANTEELDQSAIADVGTGTNFLFNPAVQTNYVLRARAHMGNGWLGWGPVFRATAVSHVGPPAVVRVVGPPIVADGRSVFQIKVTGGSATQFQLELSPDPLGPWARDSTAVFLPLIVGTDYRVTCSLGSAARVFYRVRPLN